MEYERRAEKMEGLASYVEAQAINKSRVDHLDGEKAGEVRRTCYGSGHAIATLLDSLSPGWKAALEAQARPSLDELLSDALGGYADIDECDFSERERDHFAQWAREDVERRMEQCRTREETFKNRAGRRLMIELPEGKSLQVTGMDPSNAHLVRRELGVVHTRLLQLRMGESVVEMLREGDAEVEALTVGAGPNPLFNGVKRAEFVAGEDWSVTEAQGSLKIAGRGINAELQVSEWVEEGGAIRVLLAG